jgi:hypothetical protein
MNLDENSKLKIQIGWDTTQNLAVPVEENS